MSEDLVGFGCQEISQKVYDVLDKQIAVIDSVITQTMREKGFGRQQAFANVVEQLGLRNNSSLYLLLMVNTACIMDELRAQNPDEYQGTGNTLALVLKEYAQRAGIDVDKYFK